MIEKQFVEELENRGIKYYYSGDNIMVCCPYHGENNPSLGVNFKKRVFNCFGCGESGSPLRLVKDLFEGGSVEEWEEESVLEVVPGVHKNINKILDRIQEVAMAIDTEKKEQIKVLTNFKSDFYYEPHGRYAQYLLKRKISKRSWKEFNIRCGYWKGDERILIPMYDKFGRLISIVGRSINSNKKKEKIRKSKNSDVGKILFGLYNLLKKDPHQKLYQLVLVEGEFDVIYLQQCGVPAVSLGKKFPTEIQLYVIFISCRKVILSLDSDVSREDLIKTVRLLKKHCEDVLVVALPEGKDPNDLTLEEVKKIYYF